MPNITTLLVGKIDSLKFGFDGVIDDDIVSANVFIPGITVLLNIYWLLESLFKTEFGLALTFVLTFVHSQFLYFVFEIQNR